MKKILAITVLCLILAFAMVACNTTPELPEETTAGDTTEADTTAIPDTTEPDTTEPDTTEPDTTEPDTTEDTTEDVFVPDIEPPVVTPPVDNNVQSFISSVESNFAQSTGDVELSASDLGKRFETIVYGLGIPNYVRYNDGNPYYEITSFTDMHTSLTGKYAFSVNVLETQGVAGRISLIVRGNSKATIEQFFFGQDGHDLVASGASMGGSGIYVTYTERPTGPALRINIKTYENDQYHYNVFYAPVDSSDITIADDGSTVYILAGGKKAATIAIEGTYDYWIAGTLPNDLAQKATITLADGTVTELNYACVSANGKSSDVGIATRDTTIRFDRISIQSFDTVEIPEEFYTPDNVKVNLAHKKPVTADSEENEYNRIPFATDGVDETRWGASTNGKTSLIVDLEKVYTLAEIVTMYQHAGFDYTVSVSVDGENYTEVAKSGSHGSKTVALEVNQDARYIKYTRLDDGNTGNHWFSIYEVFAFGTEKN